MKISVYSEIIDFDIEYFFLILSDEIFCESMKCDLLSYSETEEPIIPEYMLVEYIC